MKIEHDPLVTMFDTAPDASVALKIQKKKKWDEKLR